MKLIKIFKSHLLLGIACFGQSDDFVVLNKGTAKGFADVEKRMYQPSETTVFPWVKNGKILHQRLNSFHRDLSIHIYISKDGKCYYIQCDLDEINAMLAKEIEKEDAMNFLKKEMVSFISIAFMNPSMRSSLITDATVKKSSSAEREIVVKYNLNGKNLIIDKNKWTVSINLTTQNGAIENWAASGTVDPLIINTFSKTLLEPSGTLNRWLSMGLKLDPCRDLE